MGTGTPDSEVKTEVKCNHCGQYVHADCDWHQGRCPHRPSLLDQILADPYRSRVYNLVKFFTGRK